MSAEKEPTVDSPQPIRRLRLHPGLFYEREDGTFIRRPATMLRPLTFRESMLGRPATSIDLIGIETAMRDADELQELREKFENHDDSDDFDDE